MKKIEEIRVCCKPVSNIRYYTPHYYDYDIIVRDSTKKLTESNLKFMGPAKISYVMKNEFNSVRILGSRNGTNYYYYLGIPVDNHIGCLQVQASEISKIFPLGNIVDGNLIGSFKFVLSGSQTRFMAYGNQNVGYCNYWLNEYERLVVGDQETLKGLRQMLKGTDQDVQVVRTVIESLKGEYYTEKFKNGE